MARTTRDLCQDCWQDANPTEYAPIATRYGPCAECGAEALVVRSAVALFPNTPLTLADVARLPLDVQRAIARTIDPTIPPETGNPAGLPDCACCGMDFYRTADGGCTYCVTRPDGSRPICCRN